MGPAAGVRRFRADRRRARDQQRLHDAISLVAAGDGRMAPLDLEAHADEVLDVLRAIAAEASPVSPPRLRLISKVLEGTAGAALLDQLSHARADVRRAAAEACGLLQLEVAVPALAIILADRDRDVRLASIEALGMIGGHRAADALMRALRSRRLPKYRVAIALAQGAPDFYLETALTDQGEADTAPWLAIALGLRRRSSARGLLLGLLGSEDGRTRANACRALGWEANPADAPLLVERLRDDDATVREAAKTALLCLPAPVVAAAGAGAAGPQPEAGAP